MTSADGLIAAIERARPTKVVIFGAGEIGQLTHYALKCAGISIDAFCDPNPAQYGTSLRGVEVVDPPTLRLMMAPDTFVINCGDYKSYDRKAVLDLLAGPALEYLQESDDLLLSTDFSYADVPMTGHEIKRRIAHYATECSAARDEQAVILKSLDVVVTEACSMRCVDCSNLMQYYERPQHSDMDLLERALLQVIEHTAHIAEFRILGGEPFVSRQMYRVIDLLCARDDVHSVVIYTNGTIVPRNENLRCLQNPKVLVDITDYGPLSRRKAALTEALDRHGVAWILKTPTWTDSGRIGYIERTPEELQRTFDHCCVRDVVTLLNGKLYRCPFSANSSNLGAVRSGPDEVVDLTRPWEEASLRAAIASLYRRTAPLSSCSHCRGRDYSTPRVEAAIQTRRRLPIPIIQA